MPRLKRNSRDTQTRRQIGSLPQYSLGSKENQSAKNRRNLPERNLSSRAEFFLERMFATPSRAHSYAWIGKSTPAAEEQNLVQILPFNVSSRVCSCMRQIYMPVDVFLPTLANRAREPFERSRCSRLPWTFLARSLFRLSPPSPPSLSDVYSYVQHANVAAAPVATTEKKYSTQWPSVLEKLLT